MVQSGAPTGCTTPRSRPAEQTLALAEATGRAIGVTRVADLTGVDRIGLPVFQAVRPLSRSLSVSQGKGLSATDARISALLECLELHTAETLPPGATRTSPRALGRRALHLWRTLPSWRDDTSRLDPDEPQDWLPGTDLLTGTPTPVPACFVSMDTRQRRHGGAANTNGLAAGNDLAEATAAGLCEILERDALARWHGASLMQRNRAALATGTVADPFLHTFLRCLEEAGFTVLIWDLSAWHGVPTFCCTLLEPDPAGAGIPPSTGTGCHPRKAIAVFRALSEAAQTRAALIAGAREDIAPGWYADTAARTARAMLGALPHAGPERRHWDAIADLDAPDPAAALDRLLERAAAARPRALVRATLLAGDLSVVKILAPGLLNGETMA